MLDADLAQAIDGLEITFASVTIPAFTDGKTSHWADYDRLAADGIQDVTVHPRIIGRRIGDIPYLDIECVFDPETYPTETYGLIYGDDLFERSISAHLREVLGDIRYTEAGMQGDEHVSMEGGRAWKRALAGMSAHARMALLGTSQITSLIVQGVPVKAALDAR